MLRFEQELVVYHTIFTIKNATGMNTKTSIRLDKWLWAARFYKYRRLATDAINGGKIHVNGQRSKPGKDVKIGTTIKISKDQFTWEITVAGINTQRRPAKEAVLLYNETQESYARRQEMVARLCEEKRLYPATRGKPNKKDRRLIHRFKER